MGNLLLFYVLVTEQSTIDDSMNENKDNALNTLVTNEEIKDKKIGQALIYCEIFVDLRNYRTRNTYCFFTCFYLRILVSPQPSQMISNDDSSPRKSVSPKSSKKNILPASKKISPSVSRKGSKIKSSTAIRAGLSKSPGKMFSLCQT